MGHDVFLWEHGWRAYFTVYDHVFITGSGWYLHERGKKRDDTQTDKSGFYVLCNDALHKVRRRLRVIAKTAARIVLVARRQRRENETAFFIFSSPPPRFYA
jgi:hypothetical protein